MPVQPRNVPCPTCPYRVSCPSGVWDVSEYEKLHDYDAPTGEQPTAVFMCHDNRDEVTICRGWLDVHDKQNSLALRLAIIAGHVDPSIMELPPSGVPVFKSGTEAAEHGCRDIAKPGSAAAKVINKLERKLSCPETKQA